MNYAELKNVTPNLLELLEGQPVDASAVWGFETASCDEKSGCDAAKPATLATLSLCADEGGDGGLSDVRIKTDIDQVGTTVYGLPLYHFRYKTGPERFEGVMAQDVMQVMPDAVRMGEDGLYRVNYGRLGIRMTKI